MPEVHERSASLTARTGINVRGWQVLEQVLVVISYVGIG
jgi:hypothetical protein